MSECSDWVPQMLVIFTLTAGLRLTGCPGPTAACGCGWGWRPGRVWPGSRSAPPPLWGVWRSRGPDRSSVCLRPAAPTSARLSSPEHHTSSWRCSPLELCAHAHTHPHRHTRTHAHRHTRTHTRTHIDTHARIHIDTHTRMHAHT